MAANGQKLRVAVTKTSAQGKSAQSSTPNLMSFSTDENSVWFNGKRFGVISLGESFLTLTTSSNASTITTALNGFTKEQWEDAFNRGFIAVVKGEAPSIGMIYYYGSGGKKYLSISLISSDYSSLTSVDIEVGDSDENYKCTQVATNSLLIESRTVNALNNTSTTLPLSAAMGKKLQDEKLAKTDASNTYAKKADVISYYSIGELTALNSNPTQEQLKTVLGAPSTFRNAIDAGKLILVTGHNNTQSQKSAVCIIDSGNVIVKYLHPGNNDWIVIAKCVPASSGDNWDNAQFSVRIVKPSDSAGITIE